MQAKIKELQHALEGFVQQSRRSILVIGLEESELIFVMKMLQTMGQLAALDFDYDRLDEAAAKYGVLYGYYTRGKKAPAAKEAT
jgi:hypothetical protein